MQKIVAALLLALFVAPAEALAQDTLITSSQDCALVQPTVHILPPDLLRKAVFREGSRLADTLAPAPLQQQLPQRSWAGRHPVLLGALVGAGIGVGFGAIERGVSDKPIDFPVEPVFGMQGALLGAAVGFVFRR